MRNQEKGFRGEEEARRFLEKKGYRTIECNYHYGHGEIDIILRDGEVLVFCEVKTRMNDQFGPPELAITPKKQSQIRKTAEGYLFEKGIREQVCRFDVVAIRMEDGKPVINHLPNAFY